MATPLEILNKIRTLTDIKKMIYIPSLNKEFHFSPLTLKMFRDIIKDKNEIVNVLNTIAPELPIHLLTNIDITFIFLNLRIENNSKVVKFTKKCENEECGITYTFDMNIRNPPDFSNISYTKEIDNIKMDIFLKIPTIEEETQYELFTESIYNNKSIDGLSEEQIEQLKDDMEKEVEYLTYLLNINKLVINGEELKDYNMWTFAEKKEFFDNIDHKFIDENEINSFNNTYFKFITYDITCPNCEQRNISIADITDFITE